MTVVGSCLEVESCGFDPRLGRLYRQFLALRIQLCQDVPRFYVVSFFDIKLGNRTARAEFEFHILGKSQVPTGGNSYGQVAAFNGGGLRRSLACARAAAGNRQRQGQHGYKTVESEPFFHNLPA